MNMSIVNSIVELVSESEEEEHSDVSPPLPTRQLVVPKVSAAQLFNEIQRLTRELQRANAEIYSLKLEVTFLEDDVEELELKLFVNC